MRDESQADYLTRYWSSRLQYQKPRHIFIAKVLVNGGWFDAMTEHKGRWLVRVDSGGVLRGTFPAAQLVENHTSCGADLPVGSTVIILASEDYLVGMCTVERHDADQERALRRALTRQSSGSPLAPR
jgi:hypothetical protein